MLLRSLLPTRPGAAAAVAAVRATVPFLLLAAALCALLPCDRAGATIPSFFWANPRPQRNELSVLVFGDDHLGIDRGDHRASLKRLLLR